MLMLLRNDEIHLVKKTLQRRSAFITKFGLSNFILMAQPKPTDLSNLRNTYVNNVETLCRVDQVEMT